jgi:hypothetical protein
MRPESGHVKKTMTKHRPVKCLQRFCLSFCLLVVVFIATACNNTSNLSVQLIPNSAQTLEPGKALPISATLSNDPAGRGVRWTLTGAGILAAQTPTSVLYQAPSNVTERSSVIVTATSIANGSKTASLTIIVVPAKQAIALRQNHRVQGARG